MLHILNNLFYKYIDDRSMMNQGAVISAGVWGVSGGTSVPGSCPRPAWDSAGFAAAVVSLVKKYVENLKNHSAT